jgi:hypothetical protein
MTAKLEILELLESIRPDGRCDDCLSAELDIKPRQTVNMICRPLHAAGKIARDRATCSACGKFKLVNALRSAAEPRPVDAKKPAPVRPAPVAAADVERSRTDLVRICRAIWQRTQKGEAPRSISAVINQLRASGALPQHQASLMLTLCNLRNVHVYENFALGPHENAIAVHAAAAIAEWWASQNKEKA